MRLRRITARRSTVHGKGLFSLQLCNKYDLDDLYALLKLPHGIADEKDRANKWRSRKCWMSSSDWSGSLPVHRTIFVGKRGAPAGKQFLQKAHNLNILPSYLRDRHETSMPWRRFADMPER
ncbi:hypothetical protein VOI32_36005 [Paraburkholderia caribensis]|uniref:Uncharacterized protein n=2 Tax=Paraburkholderia TaxID=1822464 RepID=B2JXF4_PARP8|nr:MULTISPECIES: hypothetical protein [Paraburkholderia]ACC76312.1 hypothetical protein Bphy_7327 [Paraburkholderia phymatum STM815]MCO4881770.1 hypothetical protein [Paraburkholderia caribensis]